jgi:hypothetical protein
MKFVMVAYVKKPASICIDLSLPGTSTLLDAPGQINITLRRVTVPADLTD